MWRGSVGIIILIIKEIKSTHFWQKYEYHNHPNHDSDVSANGRAANPSAEKSTVVLQEGASELHHSHIHHHYQHQHLLMSSGGQWLSAIHHNLKLSFSSSTKSLHNSDLHNFFQPSQRLARRKSVNTAQSHHIQVNYCPTCKISNILNNIH